MKHRLTVDVSNKSPKSRVVTYKKVSPDAKVKDVIGDANKVADINSAIESGYLAANAL